MTATAPPFPVQAVDVCVRCARDADVEIGGVSLCMDCYHVAGSTCSGIASPDPVDPTC